jgi:hypothetical protein
MRTVTLLLLLTAALAPPQTVDELVAGNIEARGGAARLKALESIRIERTWRRSSPISSW